VIACEVSGFRNGVLANGGRAYAVLLKGNAVNRPEAVKAISTRSGLYARKDLFTRHDLFVIKQTRLR
jgi:hypothetical protein